MIVDDYVCFCFKQKAAYELRISDWSSDVCSSDLVADQLMPRSVWAGQRSRVLRANGWPSSLDAYLRRFERPLDLRLEMLSEAIDAGEIGIEQDRFKVPRYRPEPVDPNRKSTRLNSSH